MKNIINKYKNKMIILNLNSSMGVLRWIVLLWVTSSTNSFFTNIGPSLAKLIPNQQLSPLHFMGDPMKDSIFLCPVTSLEISEIVWSLINGAPGYDEINAVFLKSISNNITEPLVYICNLSLSDGIFPKELNLLMCCLCLKLMICLCLTTIGLSLCYVYYQMSLKKIMYSGLIDFLEA